MQESDKSYIFVRMKAYITLIVLGIMVFSCSHFHTGAIEESDSTAIVKRACDDGQQLIEQQDVDSAVSILLTANHFIQGCRDTDATYHYYKVLAQAYERKNMFELQVKNLQKQLAIAITQKNRKKIADSYFTLGVAHFTLEHFEKAMDYLQQSIITADTDSIRFLSRCHLMRAQIYLQKEMTDSVSAALLQAKEAYPAIANEEIYVITDIYLAYNRGNAKEAEEKILNYRDKGSLYTVIELLSLLQEIHESEGKTAQALKDAKQLAILNDSAVRIESSESIAKIHQLKHEEQMLKAKAERQKLQSQAHIRWLLFFLVLTLVLAVCTLAVAIFRKKAIAAHQNELEALRLAEDAQSSEADLKALNEELQRRYYEHLYAILLPILNAKRTSTGHIDLNEKSWELIEKNTDMVLPRFTKMLRRNHQTLTNEDVRFCCLVAMKVPNPVIANIYGISPTSVSVRKQRMKKKLDECITNETLENYLSKYCL